MEDSSKNIELQVVALDEEINKGKEKPLVEGEVVKVRKNRVEKANIPNKDYFFINVGDILMVL